MTTNKKSLITEEMVDRYYELNKQKKEIELELNELKDIFHQYFNHLIGPNKKAEITLNGYKLQRVIRKTEKYHEEETIRRLESLNMYDLIQEIKKPDEQKINAALSLGLLTPENLDGCILTTFSSAISVKPLSPR